MYVNADEEDLPFDHSTEHQIAIEEAAIHAAAAAAAVSAKNPSGSSVHSDAHSLSSDELMEKASSSPSSAKRRKLADATAQDEASGHDTDVKKLDHDDDEVTVALL